VCTEAIEWTPEQVASYEQAVSGADRLFALMARTLEFVRTAAPANAALYAILDRTPGGYRVGPCLVHAAENAPDPAELVRAACNNALDDPLAQRTVTDRHSPVLSDRDVGGTGAYEGRPIRQVFDEYQVGARSVLCFREHGRLLAVAVLLRSRAEDDFTELELQRLRDAHPLLETLHLTAVADAHMGARLHVLSRRYGLSQRQHTIAKLVVQGNSNAAIAEELASTTAVVRGELKEIYARLGIRNRTQLGDLVRFSAST
jgi:DNA-binding CsgD family transcriptional regulator